jgi:exosortase/archaeosortase
MFHADITFTLALIALVAAAFLVLSAKTHPNIPTLACKTIGYAVAVIAIVMLLFTGFMTVKTSLITYPMKMKYMMMQHMQKAPMMQTKKQMRSN